MKTLYRVGAAAAVDEGDKIHVVFYSGPEGPMIGPILLADEALGTSVVPPQPEPTPAPAPEPLGGVSMSGNPLTPQPVALERNAIGFAPVPGDLDGLEGTIWMGGRDTSGADCHLEAKWEFLDGEQRNILAIRGLLNFEPEELVVAANLIDAWVSSSVANEGGSYSDVAMRSSSEIAVRGESCAAASWHDPRLLPFQAGLLAASSAAAILYMNLNPHARVTHDTGYALLRYPEGAEFGEHVDEVAGNPVLCRRRLAMLVYLNDDFEGGVTRFPRQKLEIKPEKGLVIVFPTGITHPHAGLPVEAGTKYACVTWYM